MSTYTLNIDLNVIAIPKLRKIEEVRRVLALVINHCEPTLTVIDECTIQVEFKQKATKKTLINKLNAANCNMVTSVSFGTGLNAAEKNLLSQMTQGIGGKPLDVPADKKKPVAAKRKRPAPTAEDSD